jgi:hypothetical protein
LKKWDVPVEIFVPKGQPPNSNNSGVKEEVDRQEQNNRSPESQERSEGKFLKRQKSEPIELITATKEEEQKTNINDLSHLPHNEEYLQRLLEDYEELAVDDYEAE